jgi:hypothetical protein
LAPLRVVAWIVAALLIAAAAAGASCAAVARADARRAAFATARSLGVSTLRLGAWLFMEIGFSACVACGIALVLLWGIDRTVLRLGTVAPELVIDAAVLLATGIAVILASFLTSLPTLVTFLFKPLAQQLRTH